MWESVIILFSSMIFCLSVEMPTLFMHCSPDLIGHLFMAVILNSLSGKSLIYIHESVFLEFYLVLMFGTYSFVSSFSLNLSVDFCALNSHTSTSLDGVVFPPT